MNDGMSSNSSNHRHHVKRMMSLKDYSVDRMEDRWWRKNKRQKVLSDTG